MFYEKMYKVGGHMSEDSDSRKRYILFLINVCWLAVGVYTIVTGVFSGQSDKAENFIWTFSTFCAQVVSGSISKKRNPIYRFNVEKDFLTFDGYDVKLYRYGSFEYNYDRENNNFRTPYHGYNFELNEVDNDNSIPLPLAIEVLTDSYGVKLEIKNPTLIICRGYQRDKAVYHKDTFLAVIEDVIDNGCKYLMRINLCCNDEQYEKLRNLECYLGFCMEFTSAEQIKYRSFVILQLLGNIDVGCCNLNQVKMFDSKRSYLRKMKQLKM